MFKSWCAKFTSMVINICAQGFCSVMVKKGKKKFVCFYKVKLICVMYFSLGPGTTLGPTLGAIVCPTMKYFVKSGYYTSIGF